MTHPCALATFQWPDQHLCAWAPSPPRSMSQDINSRGSSSNTGCGVFILIPSTTGRRKTCFCSFLSFPAALSFICLLWELTRQHTLDGPPSFSCTIPSLTVVFPAPPQQATVTQLLALGPLSGRTQAKMSTFPVRPPPPFPACFICFHSMHLSYFIFYLIILSLSAQLKHKLH